MNALSVADKIYGSAVANPVEATAKLRTCDQRSIIISSLLFYRYLVEIDGTELKKDLEAKISSDR